MYPKPLEIKTDNQDPKFSVVEVKPLNGGKEILIDRIYRLCLHYDRIQSERDSIHGKSNKCKRYKLRRCIQENS